MPAVPATHNVSVSESYATISAFWPTMAPGAVWSNCQTRLMPTSAAQAAVPDSAVAVASAAAAATVFRWRKAVGSRVMGVVLLGLRATLEIRSAV